MPSGKEGGKLEKEDKARNDSIEGLQQLRVRRESELMLSHSPSGAGCEVVRFQASSPP